MQKASDVVTAWARKFTSRRRFFIASSVVLLVGVGLVWVFLLMPSQQELPENCTQLHASKQQRHDTCVQLEVVATPEELHRGLSGREYLPESGGMLFDFGGLETRCMWMKDMNFPLDMIWMNDSGVVVDLEADISPETYPKTFCSQAPAQYVIEVNASTIEQAEMYVGQQIEL